MDLTNVSEGGVMAMGKALGGFLKEKGVGAPARILPPGSSAVAEEASSGAPDAEQVPPRFQSESSVAAVSCSCCYCCRLLKLAAAVNASVVEGMGFVRPRRERT